MADKGRIRRMGRIVADNFLTGNDFRPLCEGEFLCPSGEKAYNQSTGFHAATLKVGTYVWFDWHARADHYFRDRSHHFWSPKVARAREVARQESRGVQARVQRAEEHARRRNSRRRTA